MHNKYHQSFYNNNRHDTILIPNIALKSLEGDLVQTVGIRLVTR